MMNDPVIDNLVAQNLTLWHSRQSYVQNPNLFNGLSSAIPVCWFGDLDSSKPKILTIGANPSSKEFIGYKGMSRFNNVTALSSVNLIEDSYNAYFKTIPYKKWFDRIDLLLNKFNASYYDTHDIIAVHLDVVSLPTYKSPALRPENRLIKAGSALSHQLLDRLIKNYNIQKIVITGGYNYKMFINLFGANVKTNYKLPYPYSNSLITRNYNFVNGCYQGVPFYGTSIYLPNVFFSINHQQLYHNMTMNGPTCP